MNYSQQLTESTTHIALAYYFAIKDRQNNVNRATSNTLLRKIIGPYLSNKRYAAVKNELKSIDFLAKKGKSAINALDELQKQKSNKARSPLEEFGYLIKEIEAVLCVSISSVNRLPEKFSPVKGYLLESDIAKAFLKHEMVQPMTLYIKLNKKREAALQSLIHNYMGLFLSFDFVIDEYGTERHKLTIIGNIKSI